MTICNPGEVYIQEGGGGCQRCPPNTFSPGGGEVIQQFPHPLPKDRMSPLHIECKGCELSWRSMGDTVVSGDSGSTLVWTVNFVRPGTLRFKVKVMHCSEHGSADLFQGVLSRDQLLEVYVDQTREWVMDLTHLHWQEIGIPMTLGTHVVRWHYFSLGLTYG